MPDQESPKITPLCVVISPPDDLIERAVKNGVDVESVIIRFTRPHKVIGRFPIQLLDGCEYIDDPQNVAEEFEEAVSLLSA